MSKENWLEEKQSAYLYHVLSIIETGTPREKLFRELAHHAESQALIWEKTGKLKDLEFQPSLKTRFVALLAKTLGPRRILHVLAGMKVRGLSAYAVGKVSLNGHTVPETVAEVGKRHQLGTGTGNIRAAIFGMNDGLVSNASLIAGVAAASSLDTRFILISGTAGLLAGALSMASGEYVSVRSQRELLEYQLALEKAELEEYPDEEAAELALIYEARGIPPEQARDVARQLIAKPEVALHTLAREELGLNPDDLGSPFGAALWSFCAFSIGALIPLCPMFFSHSPEIIKVSMGVSGVALFLTGVTVSLFSGRQVLWSGLRMLLIGGGAGVVSYMIGTLLR